jgi:gag-polypeptide of LTR copia-type
MDVGIFFHTFVTEDRNMEEHIRKLRTLQKQLHVLGDLVSDRDFCNALLTSLPGSWSTFLTAINAALPMLSSDTLIARVLGRAWLQGLDVL